MTEEAKMGEVLSIVVQLAVGSIGVDAYLNHSCNFDVPLFLIISGMTNCALIVAFLHWGESVFYLALPFNCVMGVWGATMVYTVKFQSTDRALDNFCLVLPFVVAYTLITAFWVLCAIVVLLPLFAMLLYCFFLFVVTDDRLDCRTKHPTWPWYVSIRYSMAAEVTSKVGESVSRYFRKRRKVHQANMRTLCDLMPSASDSSLNASARDQLHRNIVSHLVKKSSRQELRGKRRLGKSVAKESSVSSTDPSSSSVSSSSRRKTSAKPVSLKALPAAKTIARLKDTTNATKGKRKSSVSEQTLAGSSRETSSLTPVRSEDATKKVERISHSNQSKSSKARKTKTAMPRYPTRRLYSSQPRRRSTTRSSRSSSSKRTKSRITKVSQGHSAKEKARDLRRMQDLSES